MNTIIQNARNNGYPVSIMTKLNNNIKNKNDNTITDCTHNNNNNNSILGCQLSQPLNEKITNIFEHTNLRIAMRSRSTLCNIFKTSKENINAYLASGIYSLKCNACYIVYVGRLVAILKYEFQNIRET